MVVPNSQGEHDTVWSEFKLWMEENGGHTADDLQLWIGCRKTNSAGQLVCQGEDGYSTYQNWYDLEPNEPGVDCLRMVAQYNGRWGDRNCAKHFHVACEKKAFLQGHCSSPTRFIRATVKACLQSHEIAIFRVHGFAGCALACLAEEQCYSFNLVRQSDEVLICQLNNATLKETDELDIQNQMNCWLYEK